ncbi:hypothetical protein WICPIJ_000592 [Wickerhamomyces pijperi]|uniref:Uncharacterized protein n=1 Tax=Wickerhamomyces pijperi TaxID=599730 RepID=A0A9P8QDD8_WICPI|nr:hypothetical protein WICPIJ_000592 [Wickerhamomyces pijperi]
MKRKAETIGDVNGDFETLAEKEERDWSVGVLAYTDEVGDWTDCCSTTGDRGVELWLKEGLNDGLLTLPRAGCCCCCCWFTSVDVESDFDGSDNFGGVDLDIL